MKKILLLLSGVLFCGTTFAQFFLGGWSSLKYKEAKKIAVEKWLTKRPNMEGKFVLLNFWKTSDEACLQLIPMLNEWSKKYADELVVVGITPDKKQDVKALKSAIEYYNAIDTQNKVFQSYEGKVYPYMVLIDPHGMILWNGKGVNFKEDRLKALMAGNRSYIGKKAFPITVEKWLTNRPKMKGKFILLDFWGTICESCVAAIPELNKWSKQFADDLIIIGVSINNEKQTLEMKQPVIEYYSTIDTKGTMFKQYGATGYPYAVLIDPDGIVRWNGYPTTPATKLTAEIIGQIIEKYK